MTSSLPLKAEAASEVKDHLLLAAGMREEIFIK